MKILSTFANTMSSFQYSFLLLRWFSFVTWKFSLVTWKFSIVSRKFSLVTRVFIHQAVTFNCYAKTFNCHAEVFAPQLWAFTVLVFIYTGYCLSLILHSLTFNFQCIFTVFKNKSANFINLYKQKYPEKSNAIRRRVKSILIM